MAYIYLLKNKTTNLKYIGVKYAKNDCNPANFWKTYFTSSASVGKLIKTYGKEDFTFKIVRIFSSAEEAILEESKLIKLALKKNDYINFYRNVARTLLQCSKAGKIGSLEGIRRKCGIHSQTRDDKLKYLKIARDKQNELGINPLSNASKEKQAERGSKGGPKNKGFIWYTDGANNFKYTMKMQQIKTIENFFLENQQYKRGRK